jgi:hypothetical protein
MLDLLLLRPGVGAGEGAADHSSGVISITAIREAGHVLVSLFSLVPAVAQAELSGAALL